ncbi:InlB B-repeat-containing protein [[Clostridium] hylemonae]|nr:InlB B-repeat-containing protein [[Clostridium] hylemonae]QEK17413.1 Internalin-A [[Clostridium] hylemonae DSM 15053]
MEWNKILKHFKIASIAGAVILAVFSINQQEVKAVDLLADFTGALDIKNGNITLSKDGKYTQKDKNGTSSTGTFDGTYTISQSSDEYNITVEDGAFPVINVNGLSITEPTENESSGSGIHIKSGAVVTLVLGAQKTSFTGRDNYPGITLETGATLNIIGNGTLTVISGSGECGISDTGRRKGGQLSVGEEAALRTYSSQKEGAICADVTASSKKIVQGTLLDAAKAPADNPDATFVTIKVENRDNPTQETYPINLPLGFRSFAASTTTEGGSYVSYYPGDDGRIDRNKLLADTQPPNEAPPYMHTYNLTGSANVFAALWNLEEKEIKYEIKLNANGGTFKNPEGDKLKTQTVGYGDKITLPQENELQREGINYKFIGWYRLPDSMQAGDEWKDTDRVVQNGLELYAGWIPKKYTLSFETNGGSALAPVEVTYGSLITEPAAPEKEGFIFKGWVADGESANWDFATDTVKGDMVLTARWEPVNSAPANPEAPTNPSERKNELKKISTGDKTPLTSQIAKLFVSMAVIMEILWKKYKR